MVPLSLEWMVFNWTAGLETVGWQWVGRPYRCTVEYFLTCVLSLCTHTCCHSQLWGWSGSLLGVVLRFFMQPIRRSPPVLINAPPPLLSKFFDKTGERRLQKTLLSCFFPPLFSFWSPEWNYRGAGMTTQSSKGLMLCVCRDAWLTLCVCLYAQHLNVRETYSYTHTQNHKMLFVLLLMVRLTVNKLIFTHCFSHLLHNRNC